MPPAERANHRIAARRLRFVLIGSECLRLAMAAVGAPVFPGMNLPLTVGEFVVRTTYGSSVAAGTLPCLLAVARHNLILLMGSDSARRLAKVRFRSPAVRGPGVAKGVKGAGSER
jgi:hypothetical protein